MAARPAGPVPPQIARELVDDRNPPPVTIDCPHCAEGIGLELGTILIGLELQCPACGITFACSSIQLRQAFLMVNEMFFNS